MSQSDEGFYNEALEQQLEAERELRREALLLLQSIWNPRLWEESLLPTEVRQFLAKPANRALLEEARDELR